MENLIEIEIEIPYIFREVKTHIASLTELNHFQSRFLLMIAYKNELEKSPPAIMSLQDALRKYLNVKPKMQIMINEWIEKLFETETIIFGTGELYKKNDNIWSQNFFNMELNRKIHSKVINEQYFSLSNRITKRTTMALTSFIKGQKDIVITNKQDYNKLLIMNNPIIMDILNLNKEQHSFSGLAEDNLNINHNTEEFKFHKLEDAYVVSNNIKAQFEINNNVLYPLSEEANFVVNNIKEKIIEIEKIIFAVERKYKFNIEPLLRNDVGFEPIDIKQNPEILSNIISDNLNTNKVLTIQDNELFFIKGEELKSKINGVDATLSITLIHKKIVDDDFLFKLNFETIENEKLKNIIVKKLLQKDLLTKNEQNFVIRNISENKIDNLILDKIINQLDSNTVKSIIKNKQIKFDVLMIKKIISLKQDISIDSLYNEFKWHYGDEAIFENWVPEKKLFEALSFINEKTQNTKLTNLKKDEILKINEQFNKIKLFPIEDVRIINFENRLLKFIGDAMLNSQDSLRIIALDLRIKLEKIVETTKTNSFSKQLELEFDPNDNVYKLFKEYYAFISNKIVHSTSEILTKKDEEKILEIQQKLTNKNFTPKRKKK